MDPIELVLTDADGKPHTYTIVPFGATEGSAVLWQLLAMGSEPIARLASGALAAGDGMSLRALMDDPAVLDRMRKTIDIAGVGADIRSTIRSTNMQAIQASLVSRCTRDAKSLANPTHFDVAFARNYIELGKLLWEVIKLNRFLGQLAT